MRPRRSAALLVLPLAAAAAGCRHAAAPPAPLPPQWHALAHDPAPFAALYRLAVGNQRNLVLTVRGGGGRLALNVAVPPGGAALAVWVDGDQGWLGRVKERCREPLARGALPLPGGAALPLDARLAATLLSGLVPGGAREVAGAPGWVEATVGDLRWRARIEGPPAVCTRAVVTDGAGKTVLEAELSAPVGSVPGALVLAAGSQRAELALKEWHGAEAPAPPAWLAEDECGAPR